MLKIFLFSLLFLMGKFAWGQDLSRDIDFLETQNTLSIPFAVPFYVYSNGETSIIKRDSEAFFSFKPMAQVNARFSKSIYIKPLQSDSFEFREQQSGQEWFEVKQERAEIGVGLSTLLQNTISVGLVPYKGARQSMTRTKLTQDEKTKRPTIPKSIAEVLDWRDGDTGSFQRFGGVEVSAGVSVSIVHIVQVGLVIQNLWSLTIKKINNSKIMLSLSEEDSTKRRIRSGTFVAQGRANFFNGKRLTANFILDPANELHHELFKQAVKGKLERLQKILPIDSQQVTWKGSEKMFYFGIPGVSGKHLQKSEYVMKFDDKEEVLDVKSNRNAGFILPVRVHNRLVYQTDELMTIYWLSEMNKADISLLDKHFLRPGRLMGLKGFDTEKISGLNLIGSTLTQIGMSFTREEIASITPIMLDELLDNFLDRCRDLRLSCANPKSFNKIKKKLKSFIGKKWADFRDDLGFIMVDEPALVNAYIKTIKTNKRVYFKFLNQKYQSLEGNALVEI